MLQLSAKRVMHKFPVVAHSWGILIPQNFKNSPKAYSSLQDLQIELNITPFVLVSMSVLTNTQDCSITSENEKVVSEYLYQKTPSFLLNTRHDGVFCDQFDPRHTDLVYKL